MSEPAWAVAAAVVVLLAAGLVALWCAWTATRLDRLHLQLSSAEAALMAALARRSAVAAEVALGPAVDPATSVAVLAAAARARDAAPGDWQAQSDLTATLRIVGAPDPEGALGRASRDVEIRRGIHNDLAVRTAQLRARRRVRWFRLAGHARPPRSIDVDV